MWRAHFGRGFGPVVRQTAKWLEGWRIQQTSLSVLRSVQNNSTQSEHHVEVLNVKPGGT
jgi:hypothetical protein